MPQQNPLKFAKQGNPNAIAILINRNLKPKGITAKVSRKNNCLRIILESNEIHDQEKLSKFIRNGILKLEIAEIDTLQIVGKKLDEEIPAWSQSINLKTSPLHSGNHQQILEHTKSQHSSESPIANLEYSGTPINKINNLNSDVQNEMSHSTSSAKTSPKRVKAKSQPEKTSDFFSLLNSSSTDNPLVAWISIIFFSLFALTIWWVLGKGSNPSPTIQSLSDCEKAIQSAAAISDMQDTVEDIDPAIRVCTSMNELVSASSKFPEALDGVDEATFVANRCTYNSALKDTQICRSLLPTLTTVHYLAVTSEVPTPEAPVPVSEQETIKALVEAAQSQNQEAYNSIITSSSVALMPGGSIVDIVSTSGDLVQVDLKSRDIKGNDLSTQVLWTHSKFVQSRQM